VLVPAVAMALPALSTLPHAQGGDSARPTPTAKVAAPIDLTGYWVAVVSQDWRWRMVTPAKGDYASIPITAEAKKVGDAWDPAKDEAAGVQCKAYGAPALMAVPTRLQITWQDENTLKVQTDAGMQTRLFHFGGWKRQSAAATWQGDSVAEWETPRPAQPAATPSPGFLGSGGSSAPPQSGSLKVVTTRLRPGYLRKNGVPYSANAVLTEYWYLATARNGDQWITITSTVDDPKYLRTPWITALPFKKEPSGAKWDPTPCSAR